MSNRNRIVVHKALTTQVGGQQIMQALPVYGLQQISPFILLHHFDAMIQPGEGGFNVPPHPHRGFCPITFIYEGCIEHSDSLGNNKVIYENEVQWINANRGIIHGEKLPADFVEQGGRLQGIQLWINLPAAKKMTPPFYKPITKEEIVLIEAEGVALRLVSGLYTGRKGPAASDVITATMRMAAASSYTLQLPNTNNSCIYVLEGVVKINGTIVSHHELAELAPEDTDILVEADEPAKLLIMSGQPINEPMVSHGPYVMNTQTEILEAMRDYKDGKMGFLY